MAEITIALPTGRLFKSLANIFTEVGIDCDFVDGSRKLSFQDRSGQFRFIMAKPTDVPTYVEYGAADLGVAGKDTIMEQDRDVYELVDLKLGYCRMVFAAPNSLEIKDANEIAPHTRVATKFPHITEKFFMKKGIHVEVVKLNGSIELAPMVGLAEWIVDITSTGQTLRENGLHEVEDIARVTARLIGNKVSMKAKYDTLNPFVKKIRQAVKSLDI